MTKVTLIVAKSDVNPDFYICQSARRHSFIAAGGSVEAAKLAGELMLYKIKASQDLAEAAGESLSAAQPRLEHPIEIEWDVATPPAVRGEPLTALQWSALRLLKRTPPAVKDHYIVEDAAGSALLLEADFPPELLQLNTHEGALHVRVTAAAAALLVYACE